MDVVSSYSNPFLIASHPVPAQLAERYVVRNMANVPC